jgi:hypothetical protein
MATLSIKKPLKWKSPNLLEGHAIAIVSAGGCGGGRQLIAAA